MEYKIPFSGRAHEYTQSEVDSVVLAMQSATPLTQGLYQQAFQKKFCQYIGADHAFALNNATAGLELSAQLCQFTEGDEVIIPGHTFTASAYPFLKKGAKIVWADIDIETRVVTAETIEKMYYRQNKSNCCGAFIWVWRRYAGNYATSSRKRTDGGRGCCTSARC